jgi:hypothetical protein
MNSSWVFFSAQQRSLFFGLYELKEMIRCLLEIDGMMGRFDCLVTQWQNFALKNTT